MSIFAIGCEIETETEVSTDKPVVSQPSIKAEPMDGMVHGQAWTFISGRVKKDNFGNNFSFNFYNEDVNNICDNFSWGSDYQIIGTFPLEVGTHQFESTVNAIFSHDNSSLISFDGTLVITEITDDKIIGKMVTSFDGNNTVNGAFELTYCK